MNLERLLNLDTDSATADRVYALLLVAALALLERGLAVLGNRPGLGASLVLVAALAVYVYRRACLHPNEEPPDPDEESGPRDEPEA